MSRNTEHEQKTRKQLLEAAGQVFAEKGYDRATGKEISERAGTNTAAINYYFQGMEGLYIAAVTEAHDHFMSIQTLTTTVAVIPDAKAKLHAFITLFVRNITDPTPSTWMLKVIGREVLYPTAFLGEVRDMRIIPKLRIVKSIVAELMDLPEEHPAVGRGFISVMAPCTTMLLFDRELLRMLFPNLSLGPNEGEPIVRHLTHFAMAGLAAVSADEKSKLENK